LTVELNNTGHVAMGLNLAGSISAAGLAVQRPECCNPTGQIQGKKWNDANGNGVQDANETPLSGWTITLSNGTSAVTDVHGYYNFIGVALSGSPVYDRAVSYGVGGPTFIETRNALYGGGEIPLLDFIAGLGGRDVTRADVEVMFRKTMAAVGKGRGASAVSWIGTRGVEP